MVLILLKFARFSQALHPIFYHQSIENWLTLWEENPTTFLRILIFMSVSYLALHKFMLTSTLRRFWTKPNLLWRCWHTRGDYILNLKKITSAIFEIQACKNLLCILILSSFFLIFLLFVQLKNYHKTWMHNLIALNLAKVRRQIGHILVPNID